jgi:hypothetical protein
MECTEPLERVTLGVSLRLSGFFESYISLIIRTLAPTVYTCMQWD